MINPEESSQPFDLLTIKRLRCSCHIGCKEEERRLPQVLFITLALALDTRPAAEADDLELTVNYAHLSKEVLALCEASTCQLIETLAARLAAHCLAKERVMAVRVRIEKPAGIPNADSAVLEITRRRGEE